MRSGTARNPETPHGRWAVDVKGLVWFSVIACVLTAALFALSHRHSNYVGKSRVLGMVQNIRIVPDHAVETKWGSQLTWRADYRVGYSVGSREYAVWTDSGVRGDSEADVQLTSSRSPRSCWVRYNINEPAISAVDCR